MDGFLEVMKEYGEVREKLAVAEREVDLLRNKKGELEKLAEERQMKLEICMKQNIQLAKWANDLRQVVLDFCAQHNLMINLPQQPLTITFNGTINNNGGTLTGDINDPRYE